MEFPDDSTIEVVEPDIEERLHPSTSLHSKVLGRLKTMRDRGRTAAETRFDDMDRSREHLNLYVDLTRGARKGDKSTSSDEKEMPWGRVIVVPMSHAIMHTFLVQLMSIFGSREPIIPVRGRGPEDIARAKLIEAMLAYDCERMSSFQTIYTFMQDALISHGIMYDYWDTEMGTVVDYEPVAPEPIQGMLEQILGPDARVPIKSQGVISEGNRWRPIDPYRFFPDPRVPVWDVQNMDFVGHEFDISYMSLLSRSGEDGPYFNIKELKTGQAKKVEDKSEAGIDQAQGDASLGAFDKGFYTCTHLQVRLIPKDWDLGPEDYPQRWFFTWADDDVIIRAHPEEYDHQQATYSVAQSEHDFHSTFAPGMVEQLDGLQRFMNWSLNSHVQNISRFLNDAFIFHPSWVEAEDLFEPGPGRHIRLTDEAKMAILDGRVSASSLFHQLPVQDVTGPAHMSNLDMMMSLAERASGINGPAQGMALPTKRTATEISTIMAASSQRVAIIARLIDDMAIRPLATRSINNRVQLTEMDQYYKIVGELSNLLKGQDNVWVSRNMIQGNYDYIPNSGIHSPDPTKMADLYFNMIQIYGQNPALMQPDPEGRIPNLHEIAKEGFRNAGSKNIDKFFMDVPQMQVVPDEQAMQMAQAGNAVPIGGPQ